MSKKKKNRKESTLCSPLNLYLHLSFPLPPSPGEHATPRRDVTAFYMQKYHLSVFVLVCVGRFLIVLVVDRSISATAATALVSCTTDNSGDPSTNGAAGLAVLALAIGNVRRVQ